MTCPHEHDVGALLIGALEPEERARAEEHLRDCADCAAALEELAALPALLALAAPPDLAAVAPVPSELGWQRLRRSAAASSAGRSAVPAPRRQRARRWLAAAVVAAVLAGGGVVVAQVLTRSAEPVTVTASSGAVRASAEIRSDGPGSGITLTLRGVPELERCRLVAVTIDGRRVATPFWTATYEGTAAWTGTVDVAPDQIDQLVVDTPDGRTLVTLQA